MENLIFNDVLEARKGNYVHALELDSVCSLKSTIESLVDEFAPKYKTEDVKEFINTLSIYYYSEEGENEEDEKELYNFNVSEYLNELLD